MPYRCVVEGFSSVSTDGVWLYFWPRDEAQAKLWDRFVRSYRLERRELLYHCTTPKKRRGAYEKGQHQMNQSRIERHPGIYSRSCAAKTEEEVFNRPVYQKIYGNCFS
ncbi:hypothetical protein CAPTEDRAFT_211080 [Capitella teleta]|uniref:Uncharacterized protein n=1 Tax=Capitella teleta TaxID=283909 RepID=R7VLW9_CAPTE|nr:hypothetical protein CAPTEDRAFT_211080 [Capitella teleta]|eukprot:ELU18626.1 hypothetical protein CAPTEDRAFT_211080 [Capitella teleta]